MATHQDVVHTRASKHYRTSVHLLIYLYKNPPTIPNQFVGDICIETYIRHFLAIMPKIENSLV